MDLVTLKRRSEFLRLRDGLKWVTASFVLQANERSPSQVIVDTKTEQILEPQFGFTASKKIGNAVKRNRARRRLKEAVRHIIRDVSRQSAKNGYDYVLIARQKILNHEFKDLLTDLRLAFDKIHSNKRHKKFQKRSNS